MTYVAPPRTDHHDAAPLVDAFGGPILSLRVSLLDLCDLRCTYCMPAEGLAWTRRADRLTADDLVFALGIAGALGVRNVRLTGGEPTLLPGLPALVGRLRRETAIVDLALTTNGLLP
jgi:GTP 3',8-cyclase